MWYKEGEVVHHTYASGHVVRVVCLSDTHWEHRRIRVTDGDILIHCGDFSTRGPLSQVVEFNEWLGVLPHRHKIVIAGNHEMALDELKHSPAEIKALFTNATYLQDDEITVEGIRIYGAPWIARNKFFLLPSLKWALSTGIGSMGLGFAMSSKSPRLYEKWNNIPEGVDFLVTHMPPYQILDSYLQKNMGCPYLQATVLERVRPVVHMFGHVHDSRGTMERDGIRFINAANALAPNQPSVSFDYDVEARRVLAVYDATTDMEAAAGPEQRPHLPLKRVGSAPLSSASRRRSTSSTKRPHHLAASHDT